MCFKKILQQKKTDGEKWAHNNFANGLAEEWALSPGVRLISIDVEHLDLLLLLKTFSSTLLKTSSEIFHYQLASQSWNMKMNETSRHIIQMLKICCCCDRGKQSQLLVPRLKSGLRTGVWQLSTSKEIWELFLYGKIFWQFLIVI